MAGIQYFAITIIFLYLIFSKLSFATSKSLSFSLRLIPRDSLESPLYPGNLTKFERIKRLVNISNAKAELMRLRSTPNATFGDEKFVTALKRQANFYIAEMRIGIPPRSVYLLVDTGAGLTWTQCQPCINCFYQDYPIYDPRVSLTYRRLHCEDPRCNYRDEHSVFDCPNRECIYNIYYAGGAIGPSNGFASLESFQFLTGDDTIQLDLLFGCSNDNTNFGNFASPDNMISGVLGLNLAPESLATQLYNHNGGVFSYCVVPFDYDFDVRSHVLRFGDDVVIPERDIPTTNYFSFYHRYYYHLYCIDISIGFRRLGLPAGTFDATLGSGFVIDSGAPFTVLSTEAINGINVYQWVMTALMHHYDYYQLVRVPETETPPAFELCYRNRRRFRDFPSITFHFQGADYRVNERYVNINFVDQGFFCVAIIGRQGYSILGLVHMQDMRIIHNSDIQAIQFYPANCANDFF